MVCSAMLDSPESFCSNRGVVVSETRGFSYRDPEKKNYVTFRTPARVGVPVVTVVVTVCVSSLVNRCTIVNLSIVCFGLGRSNAGQRR